MSLNNIINNNNIIISPFLTLLEIPGPKENVEIRSQLESGIPKELFIVWKFMGGSGLFFYNENLSLILDDWGLYQAKRVYFTNQLRIPNENISGMKLFHGKVWLQGFLSAEKKNHLKLHTYTFNDEQSFLLFAQNNPLSLTGGEKREWNVYL